MNHRTYPDGQISNHNIMFAHYRKKPEIFKFVENFFGLKKGLRSMAIQARWTKYPPIRYIPANTKNMLTFNEVSYDQLQLMIGQIHFLECIFSEKIKDKELIKNLFANLPPKSKPFIVFNPLIIGMSPCIEIDVKTDFFKSYNQTMYLKNLIETSIDDMGFKYNSSFSGNGIYTIMESYYFDERDDNYIDMFETIKTFMEDINKKMKKKFNKSKANIDDKLCFWAKYFKAPFTYSKPNRISLPLSNGEINKKWLISMCKIEELDIHFEEIIKESNWEKIW